MRTLKEIANQERDGRVDGRVVRTIPAPADWLSAVTQQFFLHRGAWLTVFQVHFSVDQSLAMSLGPLFQDAIHPPVDDVQSRWASPGVARFVRDWIHRQLFTQPSAILEGGPDCRLDAPMPMRLFRIHELVVASLCEALGRIGSAGGELQVCAAVPRTWNRPEICRYIFRMFGYFSEPGHSSGIEVTSNLSNCQDLIK